MISASLVALTLTVPRAWAMSGVRGDSGRVTRTTSPGVTDGGAFVVGSMQVTVPLAAPCAAS
jgi:hypothetical protein